MNFSKFELSEKDEAGVNYGKWMAEQQAEYAKTGYLWYV